MVQMTLQVPDELAERIRPLRSWLPTILELSLVGYRTTATATATEVIEFLSHEPSPQEVLEFLASDRSQSRLRRLLALNEAGLLGEEEARELEELQKIEHILVMLKAQLAQGPNQGG